MYQKNIHNIIEYDKERKEYEQLEYDEQEKIIDTREKRLDKYELYKLKKEQEKRNVEKFIIEEKTEVKKKNQILNF